MHWSFACFLAALLFFHCSEAALAYAFNPDDAGRQSAHSSLHLLSVTAPHAEKRVSRLAVQLAVRRRNVTSLCGVRAGVAAGARA